MRQLSITLVDRQSELIEKWRSEFSGYEVDIHLGDIFDVEADAIVSPANSTGVMDGGLDLTLRGYFGAAVETNLRLTIHNQYDGDLPVGTAIVTATENARFPYLITAPTMRVPGNVANTKNAYYAMSAILRVSLQHSSIHSIVVSGLCSQAGLMPLHVVARQMRAAYERVMLRKYFHPHWIYEVAFGRFLMCELDVCPSPEDFEIE